MNACPHYIVAVDFTPACRRALREAARRASLDDARITAVHVMDEFLVHELTKALSIDAAAVRTEWETRLRKFVDATVSGGKPVTIDVRLGSPFDGIIDACQYHSANLLIMGSSGSGGTDHRIGAVAAQCVRNAPLPVMVIRHDAQETFQNILACVDFSPNSIKAVKQAIQLAKQDRATVHCLFVHQSAMMLAMSQGGFVTPMPDLYLEDTTYEHWQQQLDAHVDPLALANPEVVVKKIVEGRMSIREAILDIALSTRADLVVLGTQGGGKLRHLLIGTTAEKIIQHAPCSILAVKPDEV
jgi:universal stress protein E